MGLTDDLLNGLTDEQIAVYTARPEVEGHIVIDSNRFITVPEELRRIAVQYDHDVETVTFDCPRYWDGLDMSKMFIYINYIRPDNKTGMYLAQNITVDETDSNIMHFTWTISNNATVAKGNIGFLVCIKKVDDDGFEINHWNSELNREMYISEGLECSASIVNQYPDIITQLLTRMEYVEDIATPENMQGYVEKFFESHSFKEHIYEYLREHPPTSEEEMMGYVADYLNDHPPLFVYGSTKPGVRCLWFNTGANSNVSNQILMMAAGPGNDVVYAEVEETGQAVYDLDIL